MYVCSLLANPCHFTLHVVVYRQYAYHHTLFAYINEGVSIRLYHLATVICIESYDVQTRLSLLAARY